VCAVYVCVTCPQGARVSRDPIVVFVRVKFVPRLVILRRLLKTSNQEHRNRNKYVFVQPLYFLFPA
jgi:hypothetical protein